MDSGGSEASPDAAGTQRRAARANRVDWLVAAAAALALLTAAGSLRTLAVPYLVACAGATVTLGALAVRGRRRRARIALAAVGLAFCVNGAVGQRALARVDADWPAVRREALAAGEQRLARALDASGRALRDAARRALDAPADPDSAFDHVSQLRRESAVTGHADWSLVLLRQGRPVAWSGTVRGVIEPPHTPLAVTATPFYLELQATESRGDATARTFSPRASQKTLDAATIRRRRGRRSRHVAC